MMLVRGAITLTLVVTAFTAFGAERVVFDRGLRFTDLTPEIRLRTPAALFTLDPQTTPLTPAVVPGTRDGSTNFMPSWFPDRNQVVYVSNRGSGLKAQIWKVNLATGVHTPLTANDANNLAPVVSPDGSRIAFVSTLGVLAVEGDADEADPGDGEGDPDDGDVVVGPDPEDPEVAAALRDPRNLDLFIMNANGGGVTRLTADGIEDMTPQFSFDGSVVYFVRGGSVPVIRSIPADGEVGDDVSLAGPDGFAVTGRDLSVYGDPLGDVVFFTDLRGAYNSYDTFTQTLSTGGSHFTRPAISPDASRLVHTPGGNLTLASFAGDVSQSLLLTADVGHARWYSSPLSSLPATIRLLQPNGGETWPRGTTRIIRWQAPAKVDASVKIELSRAGIDPVVLDEGTENDGEYEWEIPADQELASNYRVTVSFVEDPAVTDTSDKVFSIVSPDACPKPGIPTNVQATDGVHTDKVRVTWYPVAGAKKYEVYRTKNLNSWFSSTLVATVEETFYDDLDTIAVFTRDGCRGPEEVVTPYYYFIKAANDCGSSGFSASDSGYRGRPFTAAAGDTLLLGLTVSALYAAARRLRRRRESGRQ